MNFIDLHQDLASAGLHPELKLDLQTDFGQLEKANAKVIFGTGFTLPEEKLEEVIERDFAFYLAQCAQYSHWRMVKTKTDVKDIASDPNMHGILFHIEGFPHFAGDWKVLEKWYSQGLRSAGLVWNEDSLLGGGTNSNIGLTELGRELIAWCEERNILIDLAHANRHLFEESIAVVQKPPFISHGGLDSIVTSERNFTYEQVHSVVSRGGIFGIFFARSFMALSDICSVTDIAAHIKIATGLFGEDGVALGTDFGGVVTGTPERLSSVENMENLWEELQIQGLSEMQIEKVAFLNAQRYLENNLPG